MYSPAITAREIEAVEAATGLTFRRYEPSEIDSHREDLEKLLKPEGGLKRPLTREENEFIVNEQVLCKLDYRYFRLNYGVMQKDGTAGGGVGRTPLWETQAILLDHISKVEERQYDQQLRGEPCDGIRIALHKARQLGATAESRAMGMHRHLFYKHHRAIAASVDPDKILELYTRDKIIFDNLPFYLKPTVEFDTKANHFSMADLKSSVLYQEASQKTGIGVGRQFDFAHLTELSSWDDTIYSPDRLENEFFPTLPQSMFTMAVLESTANGRGNWWHRFTEQVRKKKRVDWIYIFIPYYAEKTKYRRTPPDGWNPSEVSLQHAKKVYDTSPQYVGKNYELPRETLYWWESTRRSYQENGTLNLFFTNYAANSEESFQHRTRSAFPAELIADLRDAATTGVGYELSITEQPQAA